LALSRVARLLSDGILHANKEMNFNHFRRALPRRRQRRVGRNFYFDNNENMPEYHQYQFLFTLIFDTKQGIGAASNHMRLSCRIWFLLTTVSAYLP
jgi:hypothetical protein